MKTIATAKDFKFFVDEHRKWVTMYALSDWDITYKHIDEIPDLLEYCGDDIDKGTISFTAWSVDTNKLAVVFLLKDWGEDGVNDDRLIEAAQHESYHLLLGELHHMAVSGKFAESQVDKEVHETINRLMNAHGPYASGKNVRTLSVCGR